MEFFPWGSAGRSLGWGGGLLFETVRGDQIENLCPVVVYGHDV
jgi:hypothetical protein